jgi:hypothetical protein
VRTSARSLTLARWADTPRRLDRSLIMDAPIEMDDGRIAHFEGDGMGPGERMSLPTATFAVACERILSAREIRWIYP